MGAGPALSLSRESSHLRRDFSKNFGDFVVPCRFLSYNGKNALERSVPYGGQGTQHGSLRHGGLPRGGGGGPVPGAARLRAGGPARRRGEGVPGPGALRPAQLRLRLSRGAHHHEPGPGGQAEGGPHLRPAPAAGPAAGLPAAGPPAGERPVFGGAVPVGGAAAHSRGASHGGPGLADGLSRAVRPGLQRQGGRGDPGPHRLPGGERPPAAGPPLRGRSPLPG